MTEVGLPMTPSTLFADCPNRLDVLFVPGGLDGSIMMMEDQEVLEFLADRGKTARYVTSVCTGALVVGAAGLLRGYKATGHWYIRDLLSLLGATPVNERVVYDRNRITGGGAGLPETAPKAVYERLMRTRSPAISAAREKAARIGARFRN
jgi:cyclohexyl-isocyanide hydratase